jgi:hypothetical protein
LMAHQADANLLHAKEESKRFDVRRPIGFVPGVIGYEDGVTANRMNRFGASIMGNFHGMASRDGDRKTRKIRDIGQDGRGRTSIAKMYLPDPGVAKTLFEFANDNPIGGKACSLREQSWPLHGKLH